MIHEELIERIEAFAKSAGDTITHEEAIALILGALRYWREDIEPLVASTNWTPAFRESGGSLPADQDTCTMIYGHSGPCEAPEPPVLNKSGGSQWPAMCRCGHHAGKHEPEGVGPCGSVAHVDGEPCRAFTLAMNKTGGSDVEGEWDPGDRDDRPDE